MKHLRILVIDTDLFSLSKVYFGLIHDNYTAEACNHLPEVEERIKRFQPEVVIVGNAGDAHLPSLCSRLKQLGVHLLLVGCPAESERAGLAIDGFLEKPVDIGLLRRKISTLRRQVKGG